MVIETLLTAGLIYVPLRGLMNLWHRATSPYRHLPGTRAQKNAVTLDGI